MKVFAILAVLFLGWFFYFCFSSMSDISNTKSEFEQLHDAAMDRIDKGPESEFGPEVIEEYSKAAKERKERLLRFQPDFGDTGNSFDKRCGNCGKSVSSSFKAGDKCPHCHVRWAIEKIEVKVNRR